MRAAGSLKVAVRRLARDLTGRSAVELAGLLMAQVGCAQKGAELVAALARGEMSSAVARETMRRVEHEGDQARAQLVTQLGRALVTPVDVEDLFRASRSIDDVLDNLRDFVREVDLYRPDDLGVAAPVTTAISLGLAALATALAPLGGPGAMPHDATVDARKLARGARRAYQEQLALVLRRPIGPDTLKQRELLRRLDVVGLRLAEASDILADAALKRSR